MVPRALGPQAWPRVSFLTEEMPQFSCHSRHMPVRPTCGAQLLPVGVGLPGACSQQLVLSWCSWPEERTQGLMPTSRKQAWDDLLGGEAPNSQPQLPLENSSWGLCAQGPCWSRGPLPSADIKLAGVCSPRPSPAPSEGRTERGTKLRVYPLTQCRGRRGGPQNSYLVS